jgi:E3 ubiquitin-protein ligase RNF11
MGSYDGCQKKSRECVICMNEFTVGESLRYLPCMHKYHVACVDGKFAINLSVPCKFLYFFFCFTDWLLRSKDMTCPSCLEPVDAALISSYETA